MGIKSLWGRITGADAGKQFPAQQASFLGRLGDFVIVYPYGVYCDLPNDVLLARLGDKSAVPVTVKRPNDAERGEPVLFHPETNTRIILRNSGNIDVISSTQINFETPLAEFSNNVKIAGNLVVDSNLSVDGASNLGSDVTSDGTDISDTHTHDGSPTAATGPKSPTGAPL